MLADFNADGNLDIAAFQTPGGGRNSPNGYLQVLLGNGDATFTPSFVAFPLKKLYAPGVGVDVNGDGRADLVELDSLDASYNVIPAVAGPSFQVRLVSNPVIGNKGFLRITHALAGSSGSFQISTSDPAITVAASATVPAGQSFVDVPFKIGTSFNINHVFSLQVQSGSETHTVYGYAGNPALPLGFAIYVTPPYAAVTLPGGTTPQFIVGLTSIAGYASNIQLSCQGLPAGASCNIGVNSVDLPAGGQSGQFFTVSASSSMGIGTYPFKIVATDGVLTQSADLSFQVGDFSLSATPSAISTLSTATTSFFLNSSSAVGDAQSITLMCASSNPAVVCQLPGTTLSVGRGENVNIVTQNASAGTATVTVTGQVGSLTHTATVQITVGSVQGSITPTSATLVLGGAQNFTVTLTSQGGFTGDFNLSCSTDVGSVICSAPTTTLPANGSASIPLNLAVASKGGMQPTVRFLNRQRSFEVRAPLAALWCLMLLGLVLRRTFFRQRRAVLAAASVVVLTVTSLGLQSCGGGGGIAGGGGSGGGGGGGGGSTPTIIHVKVQAVSGGVTVTVGTIAITVR